MSVDKQEEKWPLQLEKSHLKGELWAQLLAAQRDLIEAGKPTLILLMGVEDAGHDKIVARLYQWFDVRGLATHGFLDLSEEERERPEYWKYWRVLPGGGQIAVLFSGWYGPLIRARAQSLSFAEEFDRQIRRIQAFERTLTENGVLLLKLWLHSSNRGTEQRGGVASEAFFKDMHIERRALLAAAEEVRGLTDTGEWAWHHIDMEAAESMDQKIIDLLLEKIRRTLFQTGGDPRVRDPIETPDKSVEEEKPIQPLAAEPQQSPGSEPLDGVDLSLKLGEDEYRRLLSELQGEIYRLAWQSWRGKHSAVFLFEGWDASGKGGAIRRLSCAMDARLYRAISISAPSDEELAHHYLWRFWRHVPRQGFVTIYDRSWYGRVLVERVENLTPEFLWRQAYEEINEFEGQLAEHGILVLKFWMHISPEKQLQRFRERQRMAWKQHKITLDDWRNRKYWLAYERAANEMILRTDTQSAPWHLISGENKKYARIQVLENVVRTWREHLRQA